MRIVVAGEYTGRRDDLALDVVERLIAAYGPRIVISHGGRNGFDQAFSLARGEIGIVVDFQPVSYDRVNDDRFKNHALLARGTQMCLVLQRGPLSERVKDLLHQAMLMCVLTYLIADEAGIPRRLREGDVGLRATSS